MTSATSEYVCSTEDRAAWLEARRSGIGGSEAGAVVGCNDWRTPLHVYWSKVAGEEILPGEAAYWGNVLEPVIAREWMRRHDHKVYRARGMYRHRDVPVVMGTPDFVTPGDSGYGRVLECKVVGEYNKDGWGSPGTDQVPDSVICQCEQYMALFPAEFVDVGVLFGGREFAAYHVPRDGSIIDRLCSSEDAFWRKHVVPQLPPEPTLDHPATEDILKRLYPGTSGERVVMPDDLVAAHLRREKIKAVLSRLEKEDDKLKNAIRSKLGEASVGELPGIGFYTRKVINRAGYNVEPTNYVDMRFARRVKEEK